MTAYAAKTTRLLEDIASARRSGEAAVGLAKPTSNLFRDRAPRTPPRVDLGHFDEVVRVDARAGIVEAE
ncbi:MAG TPA: FAD-binding protein, partial [Casimicrobiaceae bacterium]|nr:FAD-binding protein [Casimicrobiaceae bacterium]